MEKIFYITGIYFLIGALAIFFLISKKPEKKNELISKYLVYLLIVHFILISLFLSEDLFIYVAAVILMSAAIEIGLHLKKVRMSVKLVTLTIFLAVAAGFLWFAQLPAVHILFLYALIFVFDGFSQIAGQILGRHKLSPKISPNKTWEGALGGFVFLALTAILLSGFSVMILVFSVLISVVALAGDLLASAYKRNAGIKDYTQIIPGHGGMLDRFDSFIFSGSLYFVLYKYFDVQEVLLIDLSH